MYFQYHFLNMLLNLIFRTKSSFDGESHLVRNYQNILTVPKLYFHNSFQVNIFVKASSFPQTVSISVNQHVPPLNTLWPAWHKGSHLTGPLLQEPVSLAPSWELPLQRARWIQLLPLTEKRHPAASCGSQQKASVSAEVFYLSSPMPEDNREEEHSVREMLHLQESPHT